MKNKFCRELLSLTFVAMLFLQVPAQQKALKIGDPVPEAVWRTPLPLVNSVQKTLELENDRDKLILLDFWATWCSSCLKNFPKMEALEKQFEGRVKVIAVTQEDLPTVTKFFSSRNGQRFKNLETLANDKLFHDLFPHVAIPYIAWIKNGKVLSTTDAEQVTAARIEEILQDRPTSLQTVLQIGRERPLMLAEQFDLEKGTALLNYALFSKGRIRAIAPGSGFHRKDGMITGRQFTNVPLLRMYRGIAYELFKDQGQHFSRKRIVNLVKDATSLDFSSTDDKEEMDAKSYSFEFIVPPAQAPMLYPEMLQTLNAYSGYTGTLQVQRRKCWVLKKCISAESPVSKTSAKNGTPPVQPLESLLADLNDLPLTPYPIIDESGYGGQVPIDAEKISDLEALKKTFKSAGFDLEEAERDLLMLILEDRPVTIPINLNSKKH